MKTEIEKESIWLQEANVKWQQRDPAGAKALLAAVEQPIFEKQKAKLAEQIAAVIAAPTDTQLRRATAKRRPGPRQVTPILLWFRRPPVWAAKDPSRVSRGLMKDSPSAPLVRKSVR